MDYHNGFYSCCWCGVCSCLFSNSCLPKTVADQMVKRSGKRDKSVITLLQIVEKNLIIPVQVQIDLWDFFKLDTHKTRGMILCIASLLYQLYISSPIIAAYCQYLVYFMRPQHDKYTRLQGSLLLGKLLLSDYSCLFSAPHSSKADNIVISSGGLVTYCNFV